MAGMPSPTFYHRWLGWHATALRRAAVMLCVGSLATVGVWRFVNWRVALIIGWNVAALAFLAAIWPMIRRAGGAATRKLSVVEDETRAFATVLLLIASVASLLGVLVALHLAGGSAGTGRVLLIALAVSTVIVSWTVINTVFVLRYAHLYFALPDNAIDFGSTDGQTPDYRDFAYLAFTIGMTYQVSDTNLHQRRIRRTVLVHALISYLFGVVIVSGAVSLISGLVS
jgi:uncharacterized membrane protein